MIIIYMILAIIFLVVASNTAAQWDTIYIVRKVYKQLPNYKYKKLVDIIVSEESCIELFPDKSIRISRYEYLHNGILIWFNPYLLYWHYKYIKWFKKNVDINKLEDWI